MDMKTITRFKIVWAVFCAIVAIAVCIAVWNEWHEQGCTKVFSMVADWIVYCAGSVGLYICGKELVDFIDYWWFNGDEYYKKDRR
jgi:preprotein translocase subunit SecF